MGVENNECILATTCNLKAVEQIKEWVETLPISSQNLFAFIPTLVNEKITIVLGPDGSKKGWIEATRGEALRRAFIEELKRFNFSDGSNSFDFVGVGYGEYGQKILCGNCKNRYDNKEYFGEEE